MRTITKKIFSIVLALYMTASMLPMAALADGDYECGTEGHVHNEMCEVYSGNYEITLDAIKNIINTYFNAGLVESVQDTVSGFDKATLAALESDYNYVVSLIDTLTPRELMYLNQDNMINYITPLDSCIALAYEAFAAEEQKQQTEEPGDNENNEQPGTGDVNTEPTDPVTDIEEPTEEQKPADEHIHNYVNWKVLIPSTTKVSGVEEGVCACGSKHTRAIARLIDYSILDGGDQEIADNKTGDITIRSAGAFSKFMSLEIDGYEVSPTYYTVTKGSTIVTLSSEYALRLSVGTHEVRFNFTDGVSTTSLNVRSSAASASGASGSGSVYMSATEPAKRSAVPVSTEDGTASNAAGIAGHRAVGKNASLAPKSMSGALHTGAQNEVSGEISAAESENSGSAVYWIVASSLAAVSVGAAFMFFGKKKQSSGAEN